MNRNQALAVAMLAALLLLSNSAIADSVPADTNLGHAASGDVRSLTFLPQFEQSAAVQYGWTNGSDTFISHGLSNANANVRLATGNQSIVVVDAVSQQAMLVDFLGGFGSSNGTIIEPSPRYDVPTQLWAVHNTTNSSHGGRSVHSDASRKPSDPSDSWCHYAKARSGGRFKVECTAPDPRNNSPGAHIEFSASGPVNGFVGEELIHFEPTLYSTEANLTFTTDEGDWIMSWPHARNDTIESTTEITIWQEQNSTMFLIQMWATDPFADIYSFSFGPDRYPDGRVVPAFETGGVNNDSSLSWDCRIVVGPCGLDDWQLPEGEVWWQRVEVADDELTTNLTNANGAAFNITIAEDHCYDSGTLKLHMLDITQWAVSHNNTTLDRPVSSIPSAALQDTYDLTEGDGCLTKGEVISFDLWQLELLSGNTTDGMGAFYDADRTSIAFTTVLEHVGGAGSQPVVVFDHWDVTDSPRATVWHAPVIVPASSDDGSAPVSTITISGDVVTCTTSLPATEVVRFHVIVLIDGDAVVVSDHRAQVTSHSITHTFETGHVYEIRCYLFAFDYDESLAIVHHSLNQTGDQAGGILGDLPTGIPSWTWWVIGLAAALFLVLWLVSRVM